MDDVQWREIEYCDLDLLACWPHRNRHKDISVKSLKSCVQWCTNNIVIAIYFLVDLTAIGIKRLPTLLVSKVMKVVFMFLVWHGYLNASIYIRRCMRINFRMDCHTWSSPKYFQVYENQSATNEAPPNIFRLNSKLFFHKSNLKDLYLIYSTMFHKIMLTLYNFVRK